jgi:hypothetical protein
MILTNAVNGKRFVISAAFVGTMEERIDPKHTNTKTVIIKQDGSFTPVMEDIEFCMNEYERELRSMRGAAPRQVQSNARPVQSISDEELAALDAQIRG